MYELLKLRIESRSLFWNQINTSFLKVWCKIKLLSFENEFSTPFETWLVLNLLSVKLLKFKVGLEKSRNHFLLVVLEGFKTVFI